MHPSQIEFRIAALNGQWPAEKTPAERRRSESVFKSGYAYTLKLLRREVGALDPRGPVIIQADFFERDIKLDGTPRADARQPQFPGVGLFFTSNKIGSLSYRCDVCQRWQHNLHAIALTLERLRLVGLYNVANSGQQYKGWKALPAPEHASVQSFDAAVMLIAKYAGTNSTAVISDYETARGCYRAAASKLHPDAGGTPDQWQMLLAAWALVEQSFQAKGGRA
ncbi:MAG TPA: hypothetical protein VF624_15805 [Tepidisphaeraceae bacterium]|jgi:hypothetical protein